MISYWEAIVIGLIQGVTELFPSSSHTPGLPCMSPM
jgi:undecaprenyl pyrophosphate phosphatase UppP